MSNSKFSGLGFILAAAGSAVGLGNIWKFPYLAGENGGGSFIIVYLLCVLVVGISVMIMEFIIGRGKDPDKGILDAYSKDAGGASIFKFAGFIASLAPILIASFYMIIVGWIFKYLAISLMGNLPGDAEASNAYFGQTASGDLGIGVFTFLLGMGLNYYIVQKGLIDGIEKVSKYFMTALFIILIGMVGYASTFDGFGKSLEYMFSFDWSKINIDVVKSASAQAFFSLSLGMAVMVTYSMSMQKGQNFVSSALQITFLDTLAAILAGIVIFTFVFEFGAKTTAGPGLIFVVIPSIFNTMGSAGIVMSSLFFLLLTFAAITSTISMFESSAELFQSYGMKRHNAINTMTIISTILGIGCLLSMQTDYAEAFKFFGMSLFDLLDFIAEKVIFLVVTFLGSILVGWVMDKETVKGKFEGFISDSSFNIWYSVVKYFIPLFSLFVLFMG